VAERYPDRTAELKDLCQRLVQRAKKAGAQEAEAFAQRSRQASATVADGEIEELSEAASKGVGLRVIRGDRLGFASTTDFSPEALEALVSRALALSKEAAPDPSHALPGKRELGLKDRHVVGETWDDAVAELEPGWKLRAAFEMERAAKAQDARCARFEGSTAGEAVVESAIASTHGLCDADRGTHVYLSCSPVAVEGDQLQTASWGDHRRHLGDLESAEAVGREAARRAVRMLGARKPESARVPVIFDPVMSAGFVGSIVRALSGELVFKKSSFLGRSLGAKVASPLLTVWDDPWIPRALGSGPYDGEGVSTRRLPLFEQGVVRSFLYDMRTARKAGAKTTGHARRGWSGLPSVGPHQLVVEAGRSTPQEIIKGVKRGLYVTSMLGSGANVVTGDYSRGANGLWIEDGELAWPVQEATVAGSLLEMLAGIDAVGSDVQRRGGTWAPTLRFAELAVGGR
jgi:PmbA protein